MKVYRQTLSEKTKSRQYKTTTKTHEKGGWYQYKVYKLGYFTAPKGGRKLNGSIVKQCRAMVIPPAWKGVVINLSTTAKIIATGTDVKGRACALYSKRHNKRKCLEKFGRAARFQAKLPEVVAKIKSTVGKAMTHRKDKEAVDVLYLISQTAFRVGGTSDTKADKTAYGAATLLGKHVVVNGGDTTSFDFIGKKGVRIRKTIHDPLIAKMVRARKTSAWSERLFDVSPSYARNYLEQIAPGFLIKDFRTALATQWAQELTSKRKGPAKDQKTFKKWQRQVADKIAKELGNTRAIALNSYISPVVWRHWEKPDVWPRFLPKAMQGEE